MDSDLNVNELIMNFFHTRQYKKNCRKTFCKVGINERVMRKNQKHFLRHKSSFFSSSVLLYFFLPLSCSFNLLRSFFYSAVDDDDNKINFFTKSSLNMQKSEWIKTIFLYKTKENGFKVWARHTYRYSCNTHTQLI